MGFGKKGAVRERSSSVLTHFGLVIDNLKKIKINPGGSGFNCGITWSHLMFGFFLNSLNSLIQFGPAIL